MASYPELYVKLLNEHFFGVTPEQTLNTIEEEIENLRARLLALYRKHSMIKNQKISVYDENILKSLIDSCPGMYFIRTQGGDLVINLSNIPISFHIPHNRGDISNNNVIYSTLPLYSFSANVATSGNSVGLHNITDIELAWNTWNKFEYSHPHVQSTGRNRNHLFEDICFGNNRFLDKLSSEFVKISGVTDFLRGFYLWASHANLGDMYDRPAYKTPRLPDSVSESLKDDWIDKYFVKAQQWVMSGTDPYCEVLLDNQRLEDIGVVNHSSKSTAKSILLYNCIYALWLLKHRRVLGDGNLTSGYLRRMSLDSALLLDIAMALSPVYMNNIEDRYWGNAQIPTMLLAPAALKKLLERNTGGIYTDNLKPIVDTLIMPSDTSVEHIVASLKEEMPDQDSPE